MVNITVMVAMYLCFATLHSYFSYTNSDYGCSYSAGCITVGNAKCNTIGVQSMRIAHAVQIYLVHMILFRTTLDCNWNWLGYY